MMSRKRLLVDGVANARLYVRRKFWFSAGLNTRAARGEMFRSVSRLWLSTRMAVTRSSLPPSDVSEWM